MYDIYRFEVSTKTAKYSLMTGPFAGPQGPCDECS